MRKVLGYIVPIALAVGLMLVFRAHVLTVYVMPDDRLEPLCKQGTWVVLNRLDKSSLERGEAIAFRDSTQAEHIGRIAKAPGDTVLLGDTASFVIPSWHRCPRCGSNHCRNFLVSVGQTQTLVHERSISGRIRPIFSFLR